MILFILFTKSNLSYPVCISGSVIGEEKETWDLQLYTWKVDTREDKRVSKRSI